jgi:MoaA/NifB/PqqE/SkfB family radical SAM enzyme
MTVWERLARHARITMRNFAGDEPGTPPFLILFINSICNQTCEHCFYWRNLNRRDDLTVAELEALSRSLGRIENLNLSGGEPFLRKEFAEICRFFIRNNGVRQIYVPTNGSFSDRTIAALEQVLEERSLDLFAVELSLDGMPEFHNAFRGMKDAFERSMKTYDALAELQRRDQRLRIHSISTVTSTNTDEIRRLTAFLYERCPQMDHHNLALIRGDRKNPSLRGPALEEYRQLYGYMRRLWAPREEGRYGGIVDPMLQWAKTRTAEEQRQVVPCRAGVLTGVVYANGDVSVCENHPPVGNLRQKTFPEIWNSIETRSLRRSIAARECYCTNEVFLWSSINYQPSQLVKIMAKAKVWEKPKPLAPAELPPPVGPGPTSTPLNVIG